MRKELLRRIDASNLLVDGLVCISTVGATTRILSASLQCRRRGASSADRISIWGVNVRSTIRSTIRSDLSSPPAPRQTAPAGGLQMGGRLGRPSRGACQMISLSTQISREPRFRSNGFSWTSSSCDSRREMVCSCKRCNCMDCLTGKLGNSP
jgi:hypothetical protein